MRFMAPVLVLTLAGVAFATGTAGQLDTSFDGDGFAIVTSEGYLNGVAYQSDGRLVGVGVDSLHPQPWRVRRFLADGSLDLDLGLDPFGATVGTAEAVGIDSADRIYVAGTVQIEVLSTKGKKPQVTQVRKVVVVRLTPAGAIDNSFGDNGVAHVDSTGSVAAVAVDASGVVVGGRVLATSSTGGKGKAGGGSTSSGAILLLRFDTSGTLVPTFGSGGVMIDDVTTDDDRTYDIAVDSAGRTVVGAHVGASTSWHLRRYLADGTLDGSFGPIDGASTDFLRGITVDASDRVLATGWRWAGQTNYSEGIVTRYTSGGALDTSFASGGIWLSGVQLREELIDVDVDTNGKILAGGHFWETDPSSFNDIDTVVYRLLGDGSLDSTFGSGGMSDLSSPGDEAVHGAYAMAVGPAGDISFGGQNPLDPADQGAPMDWLVIRYCGN